MQDYEGECIENEGGEEREDTKSEVMMRENTKSER